tara:strand:- start:1431 stop:1976 length:546 start_codon:yes stop_codon:yes gene_type:complete
MAEPATHDYCKAAMAFDIQSGDFGATPMNGVRFALFLQSKAIMADGDLIVGVVVDSDTTHEQLEAIGAIVSAAGGGPLAMLGPLIGDFKGIERHPIEFHKNGKTVSVKIEGILDQEVVGIDSAVEEGQCITIDNTVHPANKRLNLATATRNFIKAFGIEWNTDSQKTNGHFAPFDWNGEAN